MVRRGVSAVTGSPTIAADPERADHVIAGQTPGDALRVVVMGVSGAGKSTVGVALAQRLGATFVDADSLHADSSVAKMAAGVPLTDDDRLPWLERVRHELGSHDRLVVACSTLRRSYRDVLRNADDVHFVFLDIDPSAARQRSEQRHGHFMPADLVASQFETLERPATDELDVIAVDAHDGVDTIVERVINEL